MFRQLTTLTISTLLLCTGQLCAQSPCPCQAGPQKSGTQTQEAHTPETRQLESATIVCPCYPYAFYPGYCAWYALKCGDGPVSINLPCDHGSGSCPDNNCVTVATAVAKTSAGKAKPPVKLNTKPAYDAPPSHVIFAKLESYDLVEITYDPNSTVSGDEQTIYARINRVKLPTIETDDEVYLGTTFLNGYEVDTTGYGGPWKPIVSQHVEKVGDNELLVKYKGQSVPVVTETPLN